MPVTKKQIYNISANRNFSDTLARFTLEKYGNNSFQLSRTLMLLPSRRSCIALRDSFLRISDGRPLLLPRMQPIGDVDEDILILNDNWQLAGSKLPVPAFTFNRLFILARLIMQKHNFRLDYALKLATELARLFDELEREQVSLKELKNIVPEDFAEHWQITVEFLKILSEHWPSIVKEQGLISPISYRNELLAALARLWKKSSPDYPVIVAGTTGSIPATAELITTIAGMPNGIVVLPALDTTIDKKYADNITQSHPQWGMHKLLKKLNHDINEVEELGNNQPVVDNERVKLLSEVMRPAEVSENWQALELDMDKALSGMKRIICADIQEEASVIAIVLRETLEHPRKTAALVTNNRTLARRVCSIIKRFGITIDDSAGVPLAQTPIATFLRLIAEVATSDMDDIALLSLLKHPLTKAGMMRIACVEAAREYEIQVLRKRKTNNRNISEDVKRLLEKLEQIFTPLVHSLNHSLPLTISCLPELLTLHLKCAEALAGENLWDGEEAETIIELFSELQNVKIEKPEIQTTGQSDKFLRWCYKEVFDVLLSGKVFRPEYGQHPRLKILSPIEARMQSFDCLILGGLNEESWPGNERFDPWLNRKMRSDIGLPAPESNIGLAAHDFFTLACTAETYFTCSEKINGTPATPSRWLVKLDALLTKFSTNDIINDYRWQQIAIGLESPKEKREILPPEPKPPLAARPKTLSVTQIETWRRNPYAIYASQILRLNPLEPIMRELNASDFGNAVHKILERFVKENPTTLPTDAYDKLIRYSEESLQAFLSNARIKSLWWPRFIRIAEFVIQQERERRTKIRYVAAEVSESCSLSGFTITGRADRIEESGNGNVTIVDYKTGALPTDAAIESGLSSQLVLLALIMQSKDKTIEALEYWQLQGGAEAGKIKAIKPEKITDYINAARDGLKNLIEKYNDPDFPYRAIPFPMHAGPYNDYAHLARIKEWAG